MLREAREEPVGPHMHGHTVSQVPSLAKQARSQTFPRRHQGSNSACSDTPHIAEREWLHQNQFDRQQIKLATRETRLANLETAINKIQKDMQYVKSHVNFCSSSESLSSLSSQQPQECCEDCNNLSAPESYSDFEDFEGVGKTGSGNGSGSGRCVGKTGIWEREITWSGYLFYY